MMQQWQPKPNAVVFKSGSLWDRVQATSVQALRSGALEPIDTRTAYCDDRGVPFLIRVVSKLRNKPSGNDDHNPFLPYEKSLHVADASASHVCILNKYNVVDLHLLVITREFEHQETLLTLRDFHALWRCLREYESLGFYNSGTFAGASQKHKHLQLVPLPLAATTGANGVSLDSLLDTMACPVGEITRIDMFPFRHAFVRWDAADSGDSHRLAAGSLSHYRRMMHQVGVKLPGSRDRLVETPYNLLVSRRWMLLVPRLRERFGEISLNSLAFVGSLLVQNTEQLEQLRQAGPLSALRAVALPDV